MDSFVLCCKLKFKGENEIQTRVKVGNNRREVLDELYNITGITVKFIQTFSSRESRESHHLVYMNPSNY